MDLGQFQIWDCVKFCFFYCFFEKMDVFFLFFVEKMMFFIDFWILKFFAILRKMRGKFCGGWRSVL